jgi:hypothetical protein
MDTKEFGDLIEDTLDRVDSILCDQFTPKQQALYEDIIRLTIYQSQPHPHNEHCVNQVLESLARCREVLEYGDKIIVPQKPLDNGSLFFGVN